ncbi:MAG: acetolactate synthase small subunit [Acidimicrobiales bacterium]
MSAAPGSRTRPRHHILSLLVENRAGVLSRVTALFSRRGYNIFSLAVAPTDDDAFSRISIVVDVESAPLEQVMAQLDKLVNVVDISELDPDEAREAELVLVTVAADAGRRAQIFELASVFSARIVDVGLGAVTVMLAGAPGVLDDFEELMRPYGIVELQRTGRVALPRLGAAAERRAAAAGAASPRTA